MFRYFDVHIAHLRNCISGWVWTCPRILLASRKYINQTTLPKHFSDCIRRLSSKWKYFILWQRNAKCTNKRHIYTLYTVFEVAAAKFHKLVVYCFIFLIAHSLKPDVKMKKSKRNGNILFEIQTKFFYIICVHHHLHSLTLSVSILSGVLISH